MRWSAVAGGGCRDGCFAGEAAEAAEPAGGRLGENAKNDVFKAQIVLKMKFFRWLFGCLRWLFRGSPMAFWGNKMALSGRFDDKPLQIIHLAGNHGFLKRGDDFSSSIHTLVNDIRHCRLYFPCRARDQGLYHQKSPYVRWHT
ncbi:MAG: hypothetical protein IPL32_06380 [Chloracidobacterium sp.]|nr:hypothetical protein [Chloracidobacterium sp.]